MADRNRKRLANVKQGRSPTFSLTAEGVGGMPGSDWFLSIAFAPTPSGFAVWASSDSWDYSYDMERPVLRVRRKLTWRNALESLDDLPEFCRPHQECEQIECKGLPDWARDLFGVAWNRDIEARDVARRLKEFSDAHLGALDPEQRRALVIPRETLVKGTNFIK